MYFFILLLPKFQEHVRIKRVQSEAFEFDKNDEQLSVLNFDFAMAYSCEYQNEIQSALWSRQSVNLFTAMFYNGKEKPSPYLIVTNCQKKDKDAIFKFVIDLITSEKENIKDKLAI